MHNGTFSKTICKKNLKKEKYECAYMAKLTLHNGTFSKTICKKNLKKEKYECAYMDNEGDLQESYREPLVKPYAKKT
ncbi:hypothetical protein DW723_17980 [Blautia obeum]|uniref:Uncharacterized protein n=1 Tax=Blautia obeum TaxID=40520 RepID=A0A414K4X7_9FIRM|nr:hypothetical protein DW723_17980 [Blautia obeum]